MRMREGKPRYDNLYKINVGKKLGNISNADIAVVFFIARK